MHSRSRGSTTCTVPGPEVVPRYFSTPVQKKLVHTRAAWHTQHAGLATVTAGADCVTPVYGGGDVDIADSSTNVSGSMSTDTLDVE